MVPYIICFVASCLFARLDEHLKKLNMKKLAILSAGIAIFIPCFLAGARDVGVGTDTVMYARPLFNTIVLHGYDLVGLLTSPYAENIEAFWLIMYYIIRKFTDDIFWVFFFTELACLLPVYLAIRESKIKPELKWLALFAYYCLFYCYSLNIMRQMLAISVIFYCYRYLTEGKPLKYLICTVLAMLIHKSALIGVFVWIVYATCTADRLSLRSLFSTAKKNFADKIGRKLYQNKALLLVIYVVASVGVLFTARELIIILSVFKKSFADQVANMGSSFNLSLAPLLLMMMYILPAVFSYKKLVRSDSTYRFLFFACILSIILWQLQGVSGEVYRVVLYLWIFVIIAVPMFAQKYSYGASSLLIITYYSALLFVNWYYYFVICGSGEVIPYTSKMLGIG